MLALKIIFIFGMKVGSARTRKNQCTVQVHQFNRTYTYLRPKAVVGCLVLILILLLSAMQQVNKIRANGLNANNDFLTDTAESGLKDLDIARQKNYNKAAEAASHESTALAIRHHKSTSDIQHTRAPHIHTHKHTHITRKLITSPFASVSKHPNQ